MPLIFTLLLLLVSTISEAATLTVGPGKTYATVCLALAAAANNDTIAVDAGTYDNDVCTFTQTGLTIRGVGTARSFIRRTTASLTATNGAIWYANPAGASTLTIDHIEMSGAHNLAQTASPIKAVTTTITLTDVYFHHNDSGVRGIDEAAAGASRSYDLTITNSEIAYNGGLTMGSNWGVPIGHNVNTGQCRNFTMTGSWVHDSRGGNGVQSSCNTSMVAYNRIADYPTCVQMYSSDIQPSALCTAETAEELAFPIGGTVYLIGNVIYQSVNTRNYGIIHWHGTLATAGQSNSAEELYITNNTVVDALGTSSTVLLWADRVTPSPMTMVNNLFAGFVSGSVIYATGVARTTQSVPANNVTFTTIAAANFSDAMNQNYHITSGSTGAVNAATTDPGTVHSINLNPVSNYLHPLSTTARTSSGTMDKGAYEVTATLGTLMTSPVIEARSGASSLFVGWTPAIADKAIVGYTLFRDGAIITPTPIAVLSYTDPVTTSPGNPVTYLVSGETATECGGNSNTTTAGLVRQVNTQTVTAIVPDVLGWQDLTRTDILSTIPSVPVDIVDRGGMAYDTTANRLLLFSNAQTWDSNAIVELLPTTFMTRLANVSDTHMGTEGTITAGGRPNGRQTMSGVVWLDNTDQLFVSGGLRQETGFLQDLWIWSPGSNIWSPHTPSGTQPDAAAHAAVYDPLTHHVWVVSNGCIDNYDPASDTFTRPVGCRLSFGQHPQVALDTLHRRLYLCAELECGWYDLSTYAFTAITDPTCMPLMVAYPGLAWDAVQNTIIGWIGGRQIYTLDPVTNTCSVASFEGGPGYSPTYEVGSRLQYAPDLNAFLAVPSVTSDLFLLRLSAAPPPTQPREFYSISGTGVISGNVTIQRIPPP